MVAVGWLLAAALPTRAVSADPQARAGDPIEPSDLAVPASFRELPQLAAAAETAAAEVTGGRGVVAVAAAAWGDPAMGCYALSERARFATTPADLADLLERALAAAPEIELGEALPSAPLRTAGAGGKEELRPPTGDDQRATFSFTSRAFRGTLHLRIHASQNRTSTVDLVACFYNQRYRQRASDLCAAVLEPWVTAP